MFNKKMLLWAGLFVASFVVINAGMYFFLKSTQPKMGARGDTAATHAGADSAATQHDLTAKHDSTAHDTLKTDHTAATKATHDTTVIHAQLNLAAAEAAPKEPEHVAEAVKDTSKPLVSEGKADTAAESAAAALKAAQAGSDKEMAKLAKLLESMKPDDAAAIASELKTDQIVALVMRMKDRSAGKMLAALPVDQAARVAERMSQTATRTR
ncbi:hypothetical protein EHM69_09520 [candidate division KSB1 bacterium]|nr:MAG: hypothetical protein EHM69_09520 [candidate division KSB1 bacterium]